MEIIFGNEVLVGLIIAGIILLISYIVKKTKTQVDDKIWDEYRGNIEGFLKTGANQLKEKYATKTEVKTEVKEDIKIEVKEDIK